ncbi:hypothetical protein [Myroides odoratimimus]|uniref:hypothetical protein n=1 Tax=Myroides odoratimimus TaxID=76832 RepID=UPI002578E03D|nr:hypothetical protein [Myroides odoratimimus]MDM1519234.1 hypothetical protein [Myroides odoratimimus]
MQLISSFFTGTDNLFKLLFINGLLILLVGLFYPQQKRDELEIRIVEYNSNVDILNREIKELLNESESLKSIVVNQNSQKFSKEEKKELRKELYEKIFEQDKKVILVENTKKQIEVLIKQQDVYSAYSCSFLIIGMLMSIIGLIGWGRLTYFMFYKEIIEHEKREKERMKES